MKIKSDIELKIVIGNHKKNAAGERLYKAGVFEPLPNFLWDNHYSLLFIITNNNFLL